MSPKIRDGVVLFIPDTAYYDMQKATPANIDLQSDNKPVKMWSISDPHGHMSVDIWVLRLLQQLRILPWKMSEYLHSEVFVVSALTYI